LPHRRWTVVLAERKIVDFEAENTLKKIGEIRPRGRIFLYTIEICGNNRRRAQITGVNGRAVRFVTEPVKLPRLTTRVLWAHASYLAIAMMRLFNASFRQHQCVKKRKQSGASPLCFLVSFQLTAQFPLDTFQRPLIPPGACAPCGRWCTRP
jgi:response regulator RpfG family c-di-GMP phosphodiesterase